MGADLAELASRLRRHVEVLAQRPRSPGSRAHRDAQDYIAGNLEAAGYLVQEATDYPAGYACTNLLTSPLPAGDLPLLIIGAHYDTVLGSPGADDNASAVAALLEVACQVEPLLRDPSALPRVRLQLCAYDLEEYGYLGSNAHAKELHARGENVLGMISLEMLGYIDDRQGSQQLPPHLVGQYPDVANFIGVCGNEASQSLIQAVVESLRGVAGLPIESIAVPGRGESLPPIRLSDHSPFWDHDFQALMITDTSFLRNPHYHRESDTPETLNYDFLAKVTVGVVATVRHLLQS